MEVAMGVKKKKPQGATNHAEGTPERGDQKEVCETMVG